MNAFREMAIEEALERAKTRYSEQGYAVQIRPRGSAVPSFLEGYVPDLIARRNGEGVVVAVKPVPPSETDNKRAEYFAQLVRKQPGWRFDLYLARPRQEIADAPLQPDEKELERELAVARRIALEEGPKASSTYAWGLLEAVARLLVLNDTPGEAKRYRPASVISSLASEDLIDEHEAQELYDLAAARNLIAHGFTKAEVSNEQIDFLLDIVARLLERLRSNAD